MISPSQHPFEIHVARREAVLDRLRALLVERLHVERDPASIDPDTPLFGTGLGLDSVDAVELVVSLEDFFGVKLPDDALDRRAMRTVGKLADMVQSFERDAARTSPGSAALPPAPPPRHTIEGDVEIAALRLGVAWSTEPPVVALRVHGDDAFTVMDRACAADLFVRDGQVRPTVLLDERGHVLADVYVGQDDEACLLLSEGPSAAELTDHLRALAPPGARFTIEELTAEHETLSVHGPYAWELIGELLGPDLIGLPYLYFYRTDDIFCLRAGKTGEYGYDLLVPKARAADLRARIEELGRPFDLARVGLRALDQCSLENGFFNQRREGSRRLSPIELGLSWRVSPTKGSFLGAEALRSSMHALPGHRVTSIMGPSPFAAGDALWHEGKPIGEILAAGFSAATLGHVGTALLDRPYFHAGIDGITAGAAPGERGAGMPTGTLRTVAPPVVNNRSLYINPQRHAYATRARDTFPPLA